MNLAATENGLPYRGRVYQCAAEQLESLRLLEQLFFLVLQTALRVWRTNRGELKSTSWVGWQRDRGTNKNILKRAGVLA